MCIPYICSNEKSGEQYVTIVPILLNCGSWSWLLSFKLISTESSLRKLETNSFSWDRISCEYTLFYNISYISMFIVETCWLWHCPVHEPKIYQVVFCIALLKIVKLFHFAWAILNTDRHLHLPEPDKGVVSSVAVIKTG